MPPTLSSLFCLIRNQPDRYGRLPEASPILFNKAITVPVIRNLLSLEQHYQREYSSENARYRYKPPKLFFWLWRRGNSSSFDFRPNKIICRYSVFIHLFDINRPRCNLQSFSNLSEYETFYM